MAKKSVGLADKLRRFEQWCSRTVLHLARCVLGFLAKQEGFFAFLVMQYYRCMAKKSVGVGCHAEKV